MNRLTALLFVFVAAPVWAQPGAEPATPQLEWRSSLKEGLADAKARGLSAFVYVEDSY